MVCTFLTSFVLSSSGKHPPLSSSGAIHTEPSNFPPAAMEEEEDEEEEEAEDGSPNSLLASQFSAPPIRSAALKSMFPEVWGKGLYLALCSSGYVCMMC